MQALVVRADDTVSRRISHRAAHIIALNITGISIRKAAACPICGAIHSSRIGPKTQPAEKTKRK
jgi:hypothetical protein